MIATLEAPATITEDPLPEQMTPTLPYGVGIDTHKLFIQCCITYMTATACERVEREFQTTWPDLLKCRRWIEQTLTEKGHWKPGDLIRYTIESTGCYHLPVCQALEGQPTVINPMLAGPTRRKTDVLDARMLAHHSIIALWRPSFVLPEKGEILRCLLAMRNEAGRNASRILNRINNHALRFGHTIGRDGSMADMRNRATLEDLCAGKTVISENLRPTGIPAAVRCIFTDSFSLFDMYKAQSAKYHKAALDWVKINTWPTEKEEINGKKILAILTSVPAVGEVTALTWISVISDPRRFQDKKQVAAFCGSDPSVKVSAGKTTSHTKRKGNARLHHVLKNCASQLVRMHKEPLGQWGYNILRRHRKGAWGRAISAVARRLAICMWHVHRTGFEFSYEQYRFMLVPDVPDVELEETDLHQRYIAMLKEHGFTKTGEIARAFLTTLPQQKGIGVACLTAVKEWIDRNKPAPHSPSNPTSTPPALPSPPIPPSSPIPSGSASPKLTPASASSAPSLAARKRPCPRTSKRAKSA